MKIVNQIATFAAVLLMASTASAGDRPGGMLPQHSSGGLPVFNYVVEGNSGGGTSFDAMRDSDGPGGFNYNADGWDEVRTQTWFNIEQPGTPMTRGASGYAGSMRFQSFTAQDSGNHRIWNGTTGGVSTRSELRGFNPCNSPCVPASQ